MEIAQARGGWAGGGRFLIIGEIAFLRREFLGGLFPELRVGVVWSQETELEVRCQTCHFNSL